MERAAQFRDGERVDSSTGTAERLDAVKRDRSRCRRAGATGGDGRMRVQWGLSQRACPSTGAFLNGQCPSTAGLRKLQVNRTLWLVTLIITRPVQPVATCISLRWTALQRTPLSILLIKPQSNVKRP